jgi:hypothetical protein
MKVIIHANQIEWQGRYAKHVITGLQRHGIRATVTNSPTRQPCDVAILMGPNAWHRVEQARSGPYIMFNRRFVGDDASVHTNCAVGWNGFNGRGTFCVDEVDPNRLKRYLTEEEILPWHKGTNTIYCEQSNVGRTKKFNSLQQYYNFINRNVKNPIFREKPIGEENISQAGVRKGLMKHDPKVVINLNSTISLDCLTSGIPVISLDEGDPVYPITSHNLRIIDYPDNRLEFFQYLAHCQWTEDEIKSGEFWDHIYPIRGPQLNEWTNNAKTT